MRALSRLVVLVSLLALVSVLSSAQASPVKNPDTFVYVTIGGPDSLDPAYAYDTASGEVIYNMYDNLVAYKPGDISEFVPMLATRVPTVENGLVSKDGRTYTFPIRKDVKFHNGDVLTPEDVEYSFERSMIMDPDGGPVWMLLEPLLGVSSLNDLASDLMGTQITSDTFDKVDSKTLNKIYDMIDKAVEVKGDNVVFHLKRPYPPFMGILAHSANWSVIINKKWCIAHGDWDGKADTWAKFHNPPKEKTVLFDKGVGTGPYKLVRWDKNAKQVIYTRFDGYWRGPAPVKNVVIKYIDEFNTRKLMLQNGEADMIYVPVMYLDQVKAIPGVKVVENLAGMSNTAILFNQTIPVEGNDDVGSGKLDGNGIPSDFFGDIHVRRAFNYCFDWDAYIKEVSLGQARQPKGPIPMALPYSNPKQPTYHLDLKKAEEEFKKAFGGKLWEKGFKMTISYNSGNDARKAGAEILEANIESVNRKFKVDVRGVEWSTYLDKLRSGRQTIFFMGWLPDYPDAHNFVHPYMHSNGAFAGYTGEAMRKLAREKFDSLIEQGIATLDPKKRQEIYYKLQELAYEEAIAIFTAEPIEHRVMRDWVKGFTYNPVRPGEFDFYELSK
ncbi:MAG: ABC transporter substrate-binding protein [Firmicutes bacterium]|nr:ABC transporter substrate-binding protein [Bacillota bacterium]